MIDLKIRGSYIEGNKATMYRFFDDLKDRIVFLHMKIQILYVYHQIEK